LLNSRAIGLVISLKFTRKKFKIKEDRKANIYKKMDMNLNKKRPIE